MRSEARRPAEMSGAHYTYAIRQRLPAGSQRCPGGTGSGARSVFRHPVSPSASALLLDFTHLSRQSAQPRRRQLKQIHP